MYQEKKLGMKWFYFLIYFSLWAGAIFNFITGVKLYNGSVYESQGLTAEEVYSFFPGLSGIDMVFSIIYMVFAIYQIVVRFYLARFKLNAPRMLLLMYLFALIVELLYIIVASVIAKTFLASAGEIIITIVGNGIMLYANYIYFENRNELFIR